MQKREIELKDLVNYLPYGLQLIQYNQCYTLESININGRIMATDGFGKINLCNQNGFKPILRPMESLSNPTKDFNVFFYTEIESDFSCGMTDFKWCWSDNSIKCIFANFSLDIYSYVPFEVFQYLFKNHFDVFGWINNGLAIDYYELNK